MTASTSCSWCHEPNPTTRRFCASCGYEAYVPRSHCSCRRCARSWTGGVNPATGSYHGYTDPYMPRGGEE